MTTTFVNDNPISAGTYEDHYIESSGVVGTGTTVAFKATNEITLNAGFETESGATFSAEIVNYLPADSTTRDYVNGIEYFNDELEAIYFQHGRIYYTNGQPRYEYYLKDHLGNTRYVITEDGPDAGSDADVLQETHYYPFGMAMKGDWEVIGGTGNQYRYNGKELNSELGLEWLDYGARWYDPSIARWNAVDPLVENYFSISPMVYTNNNPLRYIDPNGMYFTERSQKYLKRIEDEMNRRIDYYNKRISKAQEKGKDERVAKLTAKRDNLSSDFDVIRNEIKELADSDQAYDIFVDDKYSDSGPIPGLGTDRGGASFNFSSGVFEIVLPKGTDAGFIAHELKHAHQFEKGEYSVGPQLSRDEAPHRNLLYDISDEEVAYNRGAIFGQSKQGLSDGYKNISTTPVDATTHPTIKNIQNSSKALNAISNATKHAFRINGRTYYKKR